MNIDMAEKWPEMVLLESFKSTIRFGSLFRYVGTWSAETVENSHTFFYVSYTWYKSFSKRTHKKSSQAALQNGEQSSQSGAVVSTLRQKIF